jgi:hypothetical protein
MYQKENIKFKKKVALCHQNLNKKKVASVKIILDQTSPKSSETDKNTGSTP